MKRLQTILLDTIPLRLRSNDSKYCNQSGSVHFLNAVTGLPPHLVTLGVDDWCLLHQPICVLTFRCIIAFSKRVVHNVVYEYIQTTKSVVWFYLIFPYWSSKVIYTETERKHVWSKCGGTLNRSSHLKLQFLNQCNITHVRWGCFFAKEAGRQKTKQSAMNHVLTLTHVRCWYPTIQRHVE